MENKYKKAAEIIQNADALIFTAGAGMGVDSGLPDFRGNKGFWNEYPAISNLGISFAEMANPYWFKENPKLAWAFYGHRYHLYKKTKAHKGFDKLLAWAKQKKGGYFVFTSNVDGHFRQAGFEEHCIEEVHGSINHLQCSIPCNNVIRKADELQVSINTESFEAQEPLPRCPDCGAVARPNILMFGDWAWLSQRSEEQNYRFNTWLGELKNRNMQPVIIETGAGTAVATVRMKSERLASEFNTHLIRINPRDYHIPEYIKGTEISDNALEAIEKIDKELIL